MKKVLNNEHSLYFTTRFPSQKRYTPKRTTHTNKVTLGIGGNIGNVIQRFKHLFNMLDKDSRFSIQRSSPVLKNPPFGYLEQNYFFNAILVVFTNLSPIACLNAFQRYEYRFKRTRSFQDAPRTLDIDIIFYNTSCVKTKRLVIPHQEYQNRNSVMIPLSFINKSKNRANVRVL